MKPTLNKLEEISQSGKKALALLLDPDKFGLETKKLIDMSIDQSPDFIFMGGSLAIGNLMNEMVDYVKQRSNVPCIIFPGSGSQISSKADGLLLLSLVSGRNPDYLIGRHVESAFALRDSGLELLSTAYILIDGGVQTTANYITHTFPIPSQKPEITAATALAAHQLGQKIIYLDCGSGAQNSVPTDHIKAVRNVIHSPIIVGGGIKTAEQAKQIWKAGADVVVIGTAFEEDYNLYSSFISARNSFIQ